MVKHTKGFKGLSKKVLSAILAASMIMTSSSFVMAAEPTEEPVVAESAIGRANKNFGKNDVIVNGGATLQFNGKEQRPEVTIEGQTVEEGNFTVAYEGDWTNATVNATEQPYVVVTFQGEWAQTPQVRKPVTIDTVNISSAEVSVDNAADAYEYNGQKQVPEVSATIELGSGDEAYTYTLQSGDYEVVTTKEDTPTDAIDADTYGVTLNGKGNFSGSNESDASYEILPTAMTNELVSVTTKEIPYGTPRKELRNYVEVKDINQDKVLEPGVDYTLVAEDDKEDFNELGTYTLTVKPYKSANFNRGEIEAQYTVVQSASLASILSDVRCDLTYTNDEEVNVYEKAVTEIKEQIAALKIKDTEYEIVTEEADWKDAGEYAITIRGLQIYEGQEVSIPVVIKPYLIKDADVEAFQSEHPTSGDLADPTVVIKYNDKVLTEGTDYTYEIEKQGSKTVAVITGIGNYTTATNEGQKTLEKEVTVKKDEPMDLMDASISAEVIKENIVYAGKDITLGASDLSVTERDGSRTITLEWGKDYTIDADAYPYKDNDKPGTATVTIVGMGDYTGTRTIEFVIAGESFADDYTATMPESFKLGTNVQKVKDSITVRPNTGTGIYTREVVELYQNGKKVEKQNPTDVLASGVYTARISPSESDKKYAGTYIELTFTVLGEDVSDDMKVAEIADQVYTGSQITPSVTVTSEDGKTTYKAGEDYEVVYGENVQAGNNAGSVTVNMIGKYSGSTTVYFDITKADQTITMTNPLQERDLANGTRTTTSKNCTLKLGFGVTDTMNLSYESSDKSVATVNNGVITYQGVGECTITVTANETNNCKAVSLPITVKVGKVGTPTFTPSVTSKTAAKSITVTSSTVRGADGFEVEYSIRPDWWRSTTVDFENTGSKLYRQTIKTYHSNKKYYIRVRAYQVVDGAKVYSDWSSACASGR